jgi:hypothetical protein
MFYIIFKRPTAIINNIFNVKKTTFKQDITTNELYTFSFDISGRLQCTGHHWLTEHLFNALLYVKVINKHDWYLHITSF